MAARKFSLERGGPQRIEITWSGIWKNLQVRFDGASVGSFETRKDLEAGRELALPDGSRLHVQLKTGGAGVELHVERNGAPLPGSDHDPQTRVTAAATMLYVIAGLNAGLGLLATLGVEFLENLGLGIGSIVAGVIYGGLGFVVKAKHSRVALIVAIVLFALDGLATVFFAAQATGKPPIGGVVARIFFMIPLWKGLAPLKELNARKG